MAEGGNVSGRKSKFVQDSVDECKLPCCVCLKKNIRKEADKYCTSCLDYFCEECVKMHDFWPALSGHVFVGKTDIKRHNTGGKIPAIPTKRCSKHETKIVDMYCKTQNEVGCTTCFAMEHNEVRDHVTNKVGWMTAEWRKIVKPCRASCIKMYIPESLQELFQSEKILLAEKNLSKAVQNLKDELVLREKCKAELRDLKDKANKAMESYINEIFSTVGELKKETTADLEKLFSEVDEVIDEQNSELKTSLSTAEDVLKDAKRANSDGCNESQRYVCGIMAETAICKCAALAESLKCPSVEAITFVPHLSCQNLFEPLLQNETLGTFHIREIGGSKTSGLYKIISKHSHNVRIKVDKQTCYIRGSCTLPDGTILLTDRGNHRLKRVLPHQSSVSDHLDLPAGSETPWSVCGISQHEAAVTLPDTQQVQFVSIGKTMEKTRTMELDYMCYGIACNNGELYVSDDNTTVYVYTTAGKLLRQFSKDKSADIMFSSIYNVTVSKNGRVLYVADYIKGLLAVDTQTGHKVWQYTADDRKGATGVCVDGCDSVFVCGGNFDYVLQISESGEKIAEILTQTDGFSVPLSVCFNKDKKEMLVTNNTDNITMISLLTK